MEATTRRITALFPGKDLLITEDGVGAEEDAESIEYVAEGLCSVRRLLAGGVPVRGYFHLSLPDDWELGGLPAQVRAGGGRPGDPGAHGQALRSLVRPVARSGVLPGGR